MANMPLSDIKAVTTYGLGKLADD